jgi:release factor glutamine methyltransferase
MTIYQPAEDSYLMSRILKEQIPNLIKLNPELTFLEIIFSCDIDKKSVSHCNLLGFNCVHSDLFENIKGRYDIIIFNPPYLPQDSREPKDSQVATTGGKKGNEIILKFLQQAKNYLNKNGKIFLITSSLAPIINFENLNYFAKEVGCESLFFERLCIWEIIVKN